MQLTESIKCQKQCLDKTTSAEINKFEHNFQDTNQKTLVLLFPRS